MRTRKDESSTGRRAPLHPLPFPRALGAMLAALAAACGPSGAEGPTSAVLVSIDTLRADAVGCYGGPAGVTPTLDALAEEGVVFERARTVVPLTLPAHASMLTGMYPFRHTVRENGITPLPEGAETLAEQASEGGLATAAVVSSVVLDQVFGLDQGFDTYLHPARRPVDDWRIARWSADRVVAEAADWLRGLQPDEPFFLWLHFYDAHQPNEPSPEMLAQGEDNAYWGSVATVDRALGDFVELLRGEGRLDEVLLVVTSDHGEAFGAHSEQTHGTYCYEPTLHVPLIVRHPGGERVGRSGATVSVVDVFPTLLEGMGLEVEPAGDGRSLLHPLSDERGVYFESYSGFLNYGWSPLAGWAEGDVKYLHSPTPELYDVGADPAERRNLFPADEELAEEHRLAMEETLTGRRLEVGAMDSDAALTDELRKLGYVSAGAEAVEELPGPLEESDRPSPLESRAEKQTFDYAWFLVNSERTGEALPLLERIVRDNPTHVAAQELLYGHYSETGQLDRAIAILEDLLEQEPERANHRLHLGRCLQASGDDEAALPNYLRAVELDPGNVEALVGALQLLERAGRDEEAAGVRAALESLPAPIRDAHPRRGAGARGPGRTAQPRGEAPGE